MDIFNRTPTISEDTLQYRLYPRKEETIDKPSAATLATCIHSFVDSSLPPEFLWHRDSFELKVAQDTDTQEWFLEGRMRVGDCVDDEWCTIWLLREISSKWDVAISVYDTDGEFLLIEAADALPSWVKPTNSENRVWIYRSQLHLIGLSHVSPPSKVTKSRRRPGKLRDSDDEDEDIEDFLVVDDALKVVRDPLTDTLAPPEVTNIVRGRISEYPAAARKHVHFTKAYLPVDIAKALYVNPSLIQKATEAFYTRDAIQLRAAHKMSRFPPNTSVLTTVRMTRTAYAQLLGQKFFPPKIFGRWQESEKTKEWKWRDVGMKIAVGFEMLYAESKGKSEAMNNSLEGLQSQSQSLKDALQRNSDYIAYRQKLLSLGFFRGEVEGSRLWNELENKAISVYISTQEREGAARPSFAVLVSSAISQSPENLSSLSENEDSDDWLNVDPESFEDMLGKSETKQQKGSKDPNAMDVDQPDTEMLSEDRVASEQASRLRDLAAKVEEFVEGEGDIEGARFKDEDFSDEEFSDEESSEEEVYNQYEQDQQQRQYDMAKLVPGLEPHEYGRMPASFHSNSQKVAKTTMETDVVDDSEVQPKSTQKSNSSQLQSRPIRKPILPRDNFDGVDSDDESENDEDSEEEEDKPQVVGDIEVDMGEEEDEFLEFSRQALGISDDQWKSIIKDRQGRGAYVPKDPFPVTRPPADTVTKNQEAGSPPQPNPNLDSFEALMKAMDMEMNRSVQRKGTNGTQRAEAALRKERGKGKAKVSFEDVSEDDDEDIEAMMAEELKNALEHGEDDEDGGLGDANIDYNLIKNFLESFKSQGGLSGPVSNLAGRLQPDWKLPRDNGSV
ncbi:suppressor-like protein [Moniliophthora roreri MCA 2997]|uniref:Suppressor-like protein n=1 Tax=Moniliophthora roreri (strain MCA 2997) TaxID=1381753 RepID=V2XH14_MONRO|nr:suppressor-like protein [Moniliophthora roreri MCA 2997]